VGLDVLTSALYLTPATVRQEMVAGTIENIVLSPFGAVRSIVSMVVFPLAQALVVAVITIACAAIIFGLPLAWPSVLLAPPAALLGAAALVPLGLLAVAMMLVIKQTLSAVTLIITALSLFAGVYFPVVLLPDWLEWISQVQPFTPALDLLRHLVTGTPTLDPAWLNAAKLVGFTAVLLPLSLGCLSRAVSYSRAQGTITEY
jgi:ABC-2 type transport system permease protein